MRYFISILLIFSASSCSLQHLSHQETTRQAALRTYCDLIHMPQRPYPSVESRPYLGIYMETAMAEKTCEDRYAIRVAGLVVNSPADRAGLAEKDIIVSLNSVPVCGDKDSVMEDFRKTIEHQPAGTTLKLEILRSESLLSVLALPVPRPVHIRPEAGGHEVGKCDEQRSLLEKTLDNGRTLPIFNKVLDELYARSNLDHRQLQAHDSKSHDLQLKEVTYSLRHPLENGEAGKDVSRRIAGSSHDSHRLLHEAASLLDMDLPFSSEPEEISFPALLQVMEDAKHKIEEALSSLSAEEKSLLREKAIDPWNDSEWNRILEISERVDRREIFRALSPLLRFLTGQNPALLKEDVVKRFGSSAAPVLYEAMTEMGRVIIGNHGPNTYSDDAALILDLGGDDLYLNNAAGTRPGMPVALVIDWGGNNRYMSRENHSQGAGLLGGGILLDLGETAAFSALDGSQGAGFWGLGLLYHSGGRAVYTARRYSQAVGLMGIGMLMGGNGSDVYSASYGGQGLGLFGGAGLLVDSAGDDLYQLGGLERDFRDPEKATDSLGQGFGKGLRPDRKHHGVPGGIGLLTDLRGDDTYIADYFSQGASYYYGLGILHDLSGNDQYISGRYSQGAGIHYSAGVLIDQGGDDSYYAAFGVAQGLGHDYGVGFLEDSAGNNRYWGGTLVQAAATNSSIGIFIDLSDSGQMTSVSKGQAYAERENSLGIMITRHPATGASVINIGTKKE